MRGSAALARAPASAFEVVFTEAGGEQRRGSLAELWSVRFEHGVPARSFPSFKGQRNFTGLYYAATMNAHIGFESWLERDVAMMLDFDPDVVAFSSQPFWLLWPHEGGQRRHVPDFFARLANGTGVVVDVRPDDRIEPEDAEAFEATVRACDEVGWVFRRTGGPDAVRVANVRWLAGYRHRRCHRDEVAHRLREVFAQPAALLAGARAAGDPVAVLPVLFHLMWHQVLVADLAGGLLGPGSVVRVRTDGPRR